MSIINCKTSQSEIYLTAKTAGEAEEDRGSALVSEMMDGFSSVNVYFLFLDYKSRTTGTADGNLKSVST